VSSLKTIVLVSPHTNLPLIIWYGQEVASATRPSGAIVIDIILLTSDLEKKTQTIAADA
jgi:hypothetical protein